MFGPIRQQRSPQPRKNRRLSPLGGEPVDGVDKPTTCPPRPQEQKQKKRTFDALPKPAKLIRYRQRFACSHRDSRPPVERVREAAGALPSRFARSPLFLATPRLDLFGEE